MAKLIDVWKKLDTALSRPDNGGLVAALGEIAQIPDAGLRGQLAGIPASHWIYWEEALSGVASLLSEEPKKQAERLLSFIRQMD